MGARAAVSRRSVMLMGASAAAMAASGVAIASAESSADSGAAPGADSGRFAVTRTAAEWRARLDETQYRVLRQSGTEAPYSSPLVDESRPGIYDCRGCGQSLYSSLTKYDSGTGWPSFYAAIEGAVGRRSDTRLLRERTEAWCTRCGSHLGHIFGDGPPPSGERHCINGAALKFWAA